MSFIEDAITALYGSLPVKLVERASSVLAYQVFAKHDENGNITSVFISNEMDKNHFIETGRREVRPPPLKEGEKGGYIKPESSVNIKNKKVDLKTGKIKDKP